MKPHRSIGVTFSRSFLQFCIMPNFKGQLINYFSQKGTLKYAIIFYSVKIWSIFSRVIIIFMQQRTQQCAVHFLFFTLILFLRLQCTHHKRDNNMYVKTKRRNGSRRLTAIIECERNKKKMKKNSNIKFNEIYD